MVIFFANGRLGNQLFQYCALRNLPHADPIIAFGMDSLSQHFDGHCLMGDSATSRLIRKMFQRLGPQRLGSLARRIRLLTLAEERALEGQITFSITPGIVKRLAFVPTSYFQAENLVSNRSVGALKLKRNIVDCAASKLDRLGCSREKLVFIHIRRGDYESFPSIDCPAILPLTWYKKQMELARKRIPQAFFVIVSDDRPCVEEFFSGQGDVWVSDAREAIIDFGIMTLCEGGGIMSPSSFSWWAGYFYRRNNPNALFIAPHWWLGIRAGTWLPPQIQTNWIEYRPLVL